MKYFADTQVNKGRQPEMDLFKAICIVGMILVHVYLDVSQDAGMANTIVGDYIAVFVGAASFMICMGVGMRYSRNQTAGMYAKRAIALLTVGQLLNLLRTAIPMLIAYWIKGGNFFISNALLIFQADILSFAGLAFLVIALFKKLKFSELKILIIGLVMNIGAHIIYLNVPSPSNYALSQFLGFFICTDAESYFPLLSTFFFVAFGYFIGGYYPRIKDKDALSTRILQICLPIVAVYYFFRIAFEFPFMPEFSSDLQYVLNPGSDAVATCLVTLVILAFFHKLLKPFKGKLPGFITHLSVHINGYYCISYCLILPVQTILVAVNGQLIPGMLLPTLYGFGVVVLCRLILDLNEKVFHVNPAALKGKKMVVFLVIVWGLSIAIAVYAYPRITDFANIWNDYLLPKQ